MSKRRPLSLALVLVSACGAPPEASPSPPIEPASVTAPTVAAPSDDAVVARAVDVELTALLMRPETRAARVIVIDARDGRVLAIDAVDASGHHPELASTEVRCHGSTGKTLTLVAALAHQALSLEDTVEGGTYELEGSRISDGTAHGPMTLSDAMAFSSNVGFTHIYERLGREPLFETIEAFHLGQRIPESARTSELGAARFAYGGDLETTSLELAAAYAAIAAGGTYHAPWFVGDRASEGERVVSPEVAGVAMTLLEDAVRRDDATGRGARVEGLRVAGKTGTVPVGEDATLGVFVGIVPADAPRHVILVAVESEGSEYSGGTVAAPAFARIASAIHDGSPSRHD